MQATIYTGTTLGLEIVHYKPRGGFEDLTDADSISVHIKPPSGAQLTKTGVLADDGYTVTCTIDDSELTVAGTWTARSIPTIDGEPYSVKEITFTVTSPTVS